MHLTADVSHHQRGRALGVVVFIHALFFAALFTPAYADYLGRDAIMWFARFIIIPAGFISFVICGACALFRQDWLMRGIYAFVTKGGPRQAEIEFEP